MRILNVSDRSNPYEVGFCVLSESADLVAVAGNYAYVNSDGLCIIDVSNPSSPFIAEQFPSISPDELVISGSYLYMNDYRLKILDISDPLNPIEIGSCTEVSGSSICLADDLLYLGHYLQGLFHVIDISNLTDPIHVSTYYVDDQVHDIASIGDQAFIAARLDNFLSIDTSDPFNPVLASSFIPPHTTWDLVVSDSYAYVANSQGLYVLSVSDPFNPEEVGYWGSAHWITEIAASNNYVYVEEVGGGSSVLKAIDVSMPDNPLEVGSFDTPGSISEISISGNYAFIADGPEGVCILDISNPANPGLVNTIDIAGSTGCIDVFGNYAYVMTNSGLLIYDISSLYTPILIGSYSGITGNAKYSECFLYISNGYNGLKVIDVSDPSNPTLVGGCSVYWFASDIAVVGDLVYISDNKSGVLEVIDISTPVSPYRVGRYYTPTYGYGVYAQDGYAYVANELSGVQIYEYFTNGIEHELEPSDNHLVYVSSNPSGSSANICFNLLEDGLVRLSIYDIYGRLIQLVTNEYYSKGVHQASVNNLATGSYFANIEVSTHSECCQFVVLND